MEPLSMTAGDGWKLTGGAAAPSTANGGYAGGGTNPYSIFDSSNWTVSTGSSKASANEGIHWQWIAMAAVAGFFVYRKLK